MLWVCFSAGGPGHLVQILVIADSIKYQQKKKNLNLTASVRNLAMCRRILTGVDFAASKLILTALNCILYNLKMLFMWHYILYSHNQTQI